MNDPEADDSHLEMGHHLRECTERRGANAGGPENIASRVRAVLDHIGNVGLDLPIFLDAVCWGNTHLIANSRARYERNVLVHSSELPQILERWEKKSSSAKSALKNHALSTIKTVIDTKMDDATPELTTVGEEIEEEALLGITQEDMVKRLRPVTETLWEILDSSTTRKDQSRNRYIHNSEKV